jgi:hypothetical protein
MQTVRFGTRGLVWPEDGGSAPAGWHAAALLHGIAVCSKRFAGDPHPGGGLGWLLLAPEDSGEPRVRRGLSWDRCEEVRQNHRLPAPPAGKPMSNAIATIVVACHATARRTCHRTNPSVFKIAGSRRLRWVERAFSGRVHILSSMVRSPKAGESPGGVAIGLSRLDLSRMPGGAL